MKHPFTRGGACGVQWSHKPEIESVAAFLQSCDTAPASPIGAWAAHLGHPSALVRRRYIQSRDDKIPTTAEIRFIEFGRFPETALERAQLILDKWDGSEWMDVAEW